jgi:hypothetical protein
MNDLSTLPPNPVIRTHDTVDQPQIQLNAISFMESVSYFSIHVIVY